MDICIKAIITIVKLSPFILGGTSIINSKPKRHAIQYKCNKTIMLLRRDAGVRLRDVEADRGTNTQ